jgi:hypothetical protein
MGTYGDVEIASETAAHDLVTSSDLAQDGSRRLDRSNAHIL